MGDSSPGAIPKSRHGFNRQRRENTGRVRREDVLKHLCTTEAGALHLRRDQTGRLLRDMEQPRAPGASVAEFNPIDVTVAAIPHCDRTPRFS